MERGWYGLFRSTQSTAVIFELPCLELCLQRTIVHCLTSQLGTNCYWFGRCSLKPAMIVYTVCVTLNSYMKYFCVVSQLGVELPLSGTYLASSLDVTLAQETQSQAALVECLESDWSNSLSL